ncbi:ferredoxin reductase [Corynebacterium aquilae]|uniref:Stearoyl-CoA 9-desaturase n=1 Tax=Corynebacterium aquilae DSM 44791 TaxID=1431546 RepID=A0A1L7CE99_9CORY|nr:ferredoxin reductase [Corynebacterium aquilae]APT84200.1 stearoyl-CoA 9-desaturase [Corynebacterium aquilae DSM 44791]
MARPKLSGIRTVLRRFTTPLLPDDYTQLVNPLWSARELRGQIVHVTRATEDTVTLIIKPGWGVPVEFHAGQYIGIGVPINGRYTWRSYSLTCAPKPTSRTLEVTVRAVEKGKLSNHLVGTATPGMTVRLAAPAGDFHLPHPLPDKLLFITAGTGITPVISMLRSIEEHLGTTATDAVLVHSVRHREDLLFADDLRRMSSRGLTVHLRVTSEDGRVTLEQAEAMVPDYAQRDIYACGPSDMLNTLEQWAKDRGVDLHTERFTLDRASDATGGNITFGTRGSVAADGATTILEAGESAGVQLPFGCRMGICQTCVRELTDGYVTDLRTSEVKGPGERIRTCVCVANGDVDIDV